MMQRQLSFSQAISSVMGKYCRFSGRAARSEYWWYSLILAIVYWGIFLISGEDFGSGSFKPLYMWGTGIVGILFFLPSLGVTVRRLHDIGRGGGWIFLGLIPIVGNIILIIWMCLPSQPVTNRFGPVPNLVK